MLDHVHKIRTISGSKGMPYEIGADKAGTACYQDVFRIQRGSYLVDTHG